MQLVIQLGSNLGQREIYLARARARCEALIGRITQQSSIYETAPWGVFDQDNFLNQVFIIDTDLSATECLHHCQSIEEELGRQREVKWGPRTIDIDLLFLEQEQVNTKELKLPHPFIQERRFVLVPLCEILPEWIHPNIGLTVHALLKSCPDQEQVLRYLR